MSEQNEAVRLLGPEKITYLVTSDEDGRPDVRAMAIIEAEGLKTIWMITGKCSDKYRQLSKNPDCLIYSTDLEDTASYQELRLWGRMELLDDAESINRAWRDDYIAYFPEGKTDPTLCVLKFTAHCGVLQTPAGKSKLTL